MYSYLRVKLRRLRRKTYEDKYIRDKKLLLRLQTVLITAGPGVTTWNENNNIFTVISYFSLENKGNEPK